MFNLQTPIVCSPPPSRHSNPFATCWTKPGALAFRFTAGESADRLVARLAAQGWWGEIVGAHGSGKSTLLETLKPLLVAAGCQVTAISLRDRERRLPPNIVRNALAQPPSLVIIDGYEQLSQLSRAVLKWQCRRSGGGLLVTSHEATGLPPLVRLQPDRNLVELLVAELTCLRPAAIAPADIAASLACRGSNLRELFFDLYDRHEAAALLARTVPAAAA